MSDETIIKSNVRESKTIRSLNRRAFLKGTAMTALGCCCGDAIATGRTEAEPEGVKRIRRGDMFYRRLGRTDLMVSEISLGGSPVPPESVFKKAIEMGVNFVDTSSTYMNGNSESLIGKMIKGVRDEFHVATKFHPGRKHKTREGLIEEFEGSLSRLETDYVDLLLVHGARSPEWPLHEEVLAAFEQLKKQGKIRFTGVSCHNDPVGVLTPLIESGHYDTITVGYNAFSGDRVEKDKVYPDYLQRSGIEKVIALARKSDVGVIAMKTMAGGERQDLTAFKKEGVSLPQAKLKWVLQNRSVSAIITEMGTFDILNENLAASTREMTKDEERTLKKAVRATWKNHCRLCGTCVKACPSQIAIPDIHRCMDYYQWQGKQPLAMAAYRSIPSSNSVENCEECGRCERVCPYGLRIVHRLRSAHQMLTSC